MADLAPEEFMRRARAIAVQRGTPSTDVAPTPEPTAPDAISPDAPATGLPDEKPFEILPQSTAQLEKVASNRALAQLGRGEIVAPSKWADEDIATKLGARPGVPFDTIEGINFADRRVMELQPTDKEKLAWLKQRFGEANVRTNRYGHMIVSTRDENGVPKDVLANPLGVDWKDITEVEAAIPEIVGSVLPLVLTRGATLGPGFWKAVGTLGLTSLGGQATGAAKDILTRFTSGNPIDSAEVAKRRGKFFLQDVAMGGALGLGMKAATTVYSPFGRAGRIQFDADAARKYLLDKYGVDVEMTAGEATGHPFLLRGEGMEAVKPGASSAFQKFRKKQLDEWNDLRAIAVGNVPDTEEAGKRFLSAAGGRNAAIEFDVQRTAQAAADAAEQEIRRGIGTRVDKTVLGESIQARAAAERQAFRDQDKINYDTLFNHPKAKAFVIDADPLAKSIRSVMDDFFPKVEKTIMQPTGVLNAQGQMTTVPVQVQEILEKQIKPGLQARLQELAATKGGKVSLQSLKEIRTDIREARAIGMAIPGVKEGTLKHAEDALTDAINTGINQINDPALKRLWDTARTYHADNVGKFERVGIAELFRDPSQSGFMGPTELVSRATSGKKAQDVYTAYRDFFGPNSPQVQGIQQAIRDDVLKLGNLGQTIDAEGFVRRLEELDVDAPDVVKDVFGPLAAKLRASGMTLQAARGKTLPKEEMEAIVRSGNPSKAQFDELLAAQARRDNAYRNTLIRDINAGAVNAEKIQPTEVVNRLVFNPKTQPEHLEQLIDQLQDAPEVLEDLRRLTFKRVLDDSTRTIADTGDQVISGRRMQELFLDNDTTKARLTKVLGIDAFQDLEMIAKRALASEISQAGAKGTGGMGAAAQTSAIWERGEMKYVERAVKNFVISTVYLNKTFRNYFSNTAMDAEGKALRVNAFIASAPFINALLRTFTGEEARSAMMQLKDATDQMVRNNPAEGLAATPGTQDIPWDDFMRRANEIKARRQPVAQP